MIIAKDKDQNKHGGKIRKTKTKSLAWKKETQEENNHQHSQKEASEPHHDRVEATGYIYTLALNAEKKQTGKYGIQQTTGSTGLWSLKEERQMSPTAGPD